MNWPICLNKIFCYFADHEHYLWTLNPWNLSFLKQHLLSISPFDFATQKSLRKGELLFYVGRVDVQKGSITVGIQSFPVPRRWAFLLSSWCFCQMYDSTKRCWTSNFLVKICRFRAKQHIYSSKKTWRCIENCKGLSGADLSLCQLRIVILEYCWNIDFAHYS